MNSKSYDRITERIVSLLSQGTVPWHNGVLFPRQ